MSPLVGKELVSIPREQDAQHSDQVRHVRSPSGPHLVQREERDGPDQAEEKDKRDALIEPRYHQCAGGHADQHDHGRRGEGEEWLIRPVEERPRGRLAQVAHGQQGEGGLDQHPAADQAHPDPEEGTHEGEQWREHTPASLQQLGGAA